MQKNSFVNPNMTWKPPDKTPNLYRQAKIVKQVVEVAPLVIPFPTADFEPTERASPYVSAEEYQAQTGVKLSAVCSERRERGSRKIHRQVEWSLSEAQE